MSLKDGSGTVEANLGFEVGVKNLKKALAVTTGRTQLLWVWPLESGLHSSLLMGHWLSYLSTFLNWDTNIYLVCL